MKTVCFLPLNPAALAEMLRLARLVKDRGTLEPVLLLDGQRLPQGRTQCEREGLAWAELPGLAPASIPRTAGAAGALARLHPRSLWRSLRWRVQGPAAELGELRQGHLAELRRRTRELEAVLGRLRPAAAVLAGERSPWWELSLLGLCRRDGIPALVAPVSYGGDLESLLPRRSSPFHQTRHFPGLRASHPRQAAAGGPGGQEVFFYEAPLLAALAELDLLPPDPWAFGGGRADLVMAEGREAKQRYVRDGVNPAKVVVTGHRAHDDLFRDFQRGRQASAAAPEQGPVVLSLPQLGEEGMLDWDSHWREMRFLCRTLQQAAPARGLVSLHPKMDPAAYRFVEEEFGLRLAKERLSTFLPRARVFLAAYSSTLFWATLCQVPAVILDLYGYAYNNFDFLGGAVTIREKEALAPLLTRLLSDQAYHGELARAQAQEAEMLSPFDGNCGARIVDLIEAAAGGRLAQAARAMEEAA